MKLSSRLDDFTSFIVMDILEEALSLEARGIDVVHLEIGEPDFSPPPPVAEAMARALADGHTHYTHSLGIWPLREAISRYYQRQYGVAVSPERVCVTSGTSAAFLMLFGALLNPGDGVGMSDPGYACYPNFVRFVGGHPRPIPISEADGFQLTPYGLASLSPESTPVVIISSPANPTGTLTHRRTYEWLLARGHHVISDEIYHGLVYDHAPVPTALEWDDRILVVDGFSKRYAMTGCRLGWMVVPQALVRPINRISQNLFISPPTLSQYGGIAALDDGEAHVAKMQLEYGKRRRLLIDGLRHLGFHIGFEPQGAFYVYADISRYSLDSYSFCKRMLREAHVAATPGVDFGQHKTRQYVRFAYTRGQECLEKALERLGNWLPEQLCS
jgi:aspartate/methionine/tyrosine aminotransferase